MVSSARRWCRPEAGASTSRSPAPSLLEWDSFPQRRRLSLCRPSAIRQLPQLAAHSPAAAAGNSLQIACTIGVHTFIVGPLWARNYNRHLEISSQLTCHTAA